VLLAVSSGLIVEIVVIVIVLLLAFVLVGMYNGLVRKRNRAENAWAQVDVQLKRRHDLIPNLVETVKGYAAHERGTLDEVTAARAAAVSAGNVEARAQAETALTGALGRLMAVAEAYPDLKANQNFLQLQGELADLENKIAAARRFFNNAVGEYNASIQRFPAVLIAGAAGFQSREFFDVGADRAALQSAPQVKFS
jgi:LemA protein